MQKGEYGTETTDAMGAFIHSADVVATHCAHGSTRETMFFKVSFVNSTDLVESGKVVEIFGELILC